MAAHSMSVCQGSRSGWSGAAHAPLPEVASREFYPEGGVGREIHYRVVRVGRSPCCAGRRRHAEHRRDPAPAARPDGTPPVGIAHAPVHAWRWRSRSRGDVSEGRYQLYGDGKSVPYYWVWIPSGTTPPVPPAPPRLP